MYGADRTELMTPALIALAKLALAAAIAALLFWFVFGVETWLEARKNRKAVERVTEKYPPGKRSGTRP